MGILVWTLGLPTVATVLAIAWVAWASRPRGPVETHESLAAHERFKRAMAKPPAPRRPESRSRPEPQRGAAATARRRPPEPRQPVDSPSRRAS